MNIREIFEKIEPNIIDRYIEEKQGEHLQLEFKTISKSDFSHKDDKKNYAKALSGFANSSGGLIFWGVVAEKNDENIDCACGKKEIEPLSQFVARLNELEGSFVSPIVEGVEHKPLYESDDKGYAVTLVPPSDSGPHMAKSGEDRYYKRSGDSFMKMEHFDLEDMFGRRKKPKLSLYTAVRRSFQSGGPRGRSIQCKIILGIMNTGRATAKYPFLSLIVNKPYAICHYGIDGNKNTGLPVLPQGTEKGISLFGGSSNIVIHPKTILEVTTIRFNVHDNTESIDDVIIDSEIIAEDFLPFEEKKIIKGDEIREVLNI